MHEKKNVLLIVIDQLRADCVWGGLSAYVDLPNLRALMDDAVTFSRNYSVTNPCGPSRASILTGLYAMNHRAVRNGTPLRADISNIALEVRKAGYEPLLFGYTDTSADPRKHHPEDPQIRNWEGPMQGFRQVVEMQQGSECFPWRAHLRRNGYELPEYSRFYTPIQFDEHCGPRPDDPAFYSAEHSDTAFLADACIDELAVRSDCKWFAHVTFIRPHPPLIAPAPYNRMYSPSSMPPTVRQKTPEDEAALHPFLAADLTHDAINDVVEGYDACLDNENGKDVQTLRAVYLGLATEVDFHLGRIVEFLKSSGQYDSTLLVVCSDHGEMLGDHRQWGKTTMFDTAYQTVLLIRDPFRPNNHGRRVDVFSESVDVAPTILDWLDSPVPRAMNGCSLMPFLNGEEPTNWRDYSYSELDFAEPGKTTVWQKAMGLSFRESNLAILRERQFKLVHFNGGQQPLLFDMISDAGEMVNLANDPAYADTLLRMTQKLLNHRMRCADHTLSDMRISPSGTVIHDPRLSHAPHSEAAPLGVVAGETAGTGLYIGAHVQAHQLDQAIPEVGPVY